MTRQERLANWFKVAAGNAINAEASTREECPYQCETCDGKIFANSGRLCHECLRLVADTLRSSADVERELERLRSINDVAHAYLAEHPADDGDPVTEEWLRSIGWITRYWEGALNSPLSQDNVYVSYSLVGVSWKWCLSMESEDDPDGLHFTRDILKNRGQVRRLLKALGITPNSKDGGE